MDSHHGGSHTDQCLFTISGEQSQTKNLSVSLSRSRQGCSEIGPITILQVSCPDTANGSESLETIPSSLSCPCWVRLRQQRNLCFKAQCVSQSLGVFCQSHIPSPPQQRQKIKLSAEHSLPQSAGETQEQKQQA